MTHKVLICTVTAILLLSGCAQSAPDIPGNNVLGTDALSGDTVSINENNYGNENSSNANAKYNSSSDGFRSVYFDFGDYALSPQMESNMNVNIQRASSVSGKIKIEGNCDEFGTDEYNYALGLKRAKAVKDTLVSGGVDPYKLLLVSYGESNPVCQTASDSCYARNRRVDLRLAR